MIRKLFSAQQECHNVFTGLKHWLHAEEWQCASGGESRCYSRMSTAGDADGFVINLQADGAGKLALQTLSVLQLGLGMRLSELGSWNKTAEHRHHERWMPLSAASSLKRASSFRLLPALCVSPARMSKPKLRRKIKGVKQRYMAHLFSHHRKHTLSHAVVAKK